MAFFKVTKKQEGGGTIVIDDIIPRMTSDTTPKGECSASYVYPNRYAYYGFRTLSNGSTSQERDFWYNNAAGNWIQYEFDEFVTVFEVSFGTIENYSGSKFKFQFSSDGTTWTDDETRTLVDGNYTHYKLSTPIYCKYFRIYCIDLIYVISGIRAYGIVGQYSPNQFSEEFFSCAKMNSVGIILPFTLNSDYKITVKFYETSYTNDAAIFGNTSGASYAHLTEYSSKWYTAKGTGEVNFGSWVANVEHTYIYNNGNGKNEFDGTEVSANNGYTDASLKYTIGCRGSKTSNLWGEYIKLFKIENISTGNAICELKPYKLFKNGYMISQGLYDVVNNKLYSTENMVVSNDY